MEEGSSLWERLMHNFSEEDEDQEDVEREILSLVQEGRERGFFAGSEGELISNVFEYSEKKAEDIMTHRKYIIGIDGNETLENALQFILKQNHSRFPVYDGDIDTIIPVFRYMMEILIRLLGFFIFETLCVVILMKLCVASQSKS